ncbi:MAG TPA: hypothetical protein VM121_01880 [Acidimicrobiales bacterium]|nr:hypothetical protein [Acidimicrobiales bacterium]
MSPSAVAPDLHQLAGAVRPLALAGERILPVSPALESLLPDRGLRRGSVVAVTGRAGATSLALALIAPASAGGSWCAAVGVGRSSLGLAAAAEAGVVLERFPVVSASSGNGPGGWAWVVAALLDAIDIIVIWPPSHLRATDVRRLTARGRERGAVLVVADAGARWPVPVDVTLCASKVEWQGIGQGHGRLEARSIEVVAAGRGAAARERRAQLWLPVEPFRFMHSESCDRARIHPDHSLTGA